ncbi:MAG: lipoprotein [Zhongshania sp.]|uniref:LPS translocon maturation chaperone LptM n=1 Tax=Zhongshania sp. TaxID=1971902 RepID=UPI00261F1394|nr:lipoprotein [Zhongshania sp.]MDF1692650.1 lipoprotein [Zhongshania sp.]
MAAFPIVAFARPAALCLAVLLTGCGQTGPLVYPENNDAAASATGNNSVNSTASTPTTEPSPSKPL